MSAKILFDWYVYIHRFLTWIVDTLPPPLRHLIFKTVFKRFGRNNFIDYDCYFRYPWKIELGENVSINRGARFYPSAQVKDAVIRLGNHIALGPQVTFLGAGHDYRELSLPDTADSIEIKDHVWIGGNSTICQGVTIGEGAIVAAGSVVVKDVEPYTVVAGVPAKYVKDRQLNSESEHE